MNETMYAFVYGTLKKGFRNHNVLGDARFIKEAVTKPKYKIYDCGHYPCLVKDKNGNAIVGEIYEINNKILKRLDILEGVPSLYQRDNIELEDFDFPILAYFYQRSVKNFEDCGTVWPRKTFFSPV